MRRIFENSLFTRILIYISLIIEDLYVFLYQVLSGVLCEGNKKRLRFSLDHIYGLLLLRQLRDI